MFFIRIESYCPVRKSGPTTMPSPKEFNRSYRIRGVLTSTVSHVQPAGTKNPKHQLKAITMSDNKPQHHIPPHNCRLLCDARETRTLLSVGLAQVVNTYLPRSRTMPTSVSRRLSAQAVAFLFFLAVLVASVSDVRAGNTYYTLSLPSLSNAGGYCSMTLTGYLTTDGTTGLLSTSDLTAMTYLSVSIPPYPGSGSAWANASFSGGIFATPTTIYMLPGSSMDFSAPASLNDGGTVAPGEIDASYAFTPPYLTIYARMAEGGYGVGGGGNYDGWSVDPVTGGLAIASATSLWASAVNGSWSESTEWTGEVPNAIGVWAVIAAPTRSQLTVTLDSPQTIGGLVLGNAYSNTVGYTLIGNGSNTLTLNSPGNGATIAVTDGRHVINAPVVLANNLLVISGSTKAWMLGFGTASSISDNGIGYSLTMSGADGTLILSGSNTYSGGTTVSAGVLTFLNREAQPNSGTTTVAAGATLGLGVGSNANLYGSADLDKLFAGTMSNVTSDLDSNGGIDTTAGNFTYASNIPYTTVGLTKLGPNTLTLTGSNAYTGRTTISGGTLQLGDGSPGHDGITLTGNIVNNAALVYNLNGNQTYSGLVSGNGSLTKAGIGTLTLANNCSTYSGATVIRGGVLQLQPSGARAAPRAVPWLITRSTTAPPPMSAAMATTAP